MSLERSRRRQSQLETGRDVRQHDHVVAQGLLDRGAAVVTVGESQDGIGVGVIDVGAGQEGVHQSLDGRSGTVGAQQVGAQLLHHLAVVHLAQHAQTAQVVEIEPRMSGRFDGRHVDTRGLDEDRG